jgi:pilus assembly protein CpaB
MDRRRILLVVAVVVAVMGSALVFLYVKGADNRAQKKFDTVEVLKATAEIDPGETIEDAQASGKLALSKIPQDQLLAGAQTSTESLAGTVALSVVYPGEQIIAAKFGATAAVQSDLQIPDGMMAKSVNLTDPGRVAGFVNPGSQVAVFVSGTDDSGATYTRMLLDRVTVLGVGNTTPVSTTKVDQTGASTTEQLPRTLITLALSQNQVEKVEFGASNGELSLALLTDKSTVQPDPTGVTAATLFK